MFYVHVKDNKKAIFLFNVIVYYNDDDDDSDSDVNSNTLEIR